jgi:hypothetical protein
MTARPSSKRKELLVSLSRSALLKSLVGDVLLWAGFGVGLVVSTAAGAVLDGTAKNLVTYAGIAVALVAGAPIAKKPRIKAFLSTRPVLWFLFLFNGAVAAVCGLTMDGAQGITAAALMGLVSLGAAGGLVASRRKQVRA